MPKIASYSKFIIIYSNKIYVFEPNVSPNALKCVDPLAQINSKPQENKNIVDALQVSPCGRYLAASVGKELILLSFPDCQVLAKASIEKTASSLQFFNKQEMLLIADRSGSVTFIRYSDRNLLRENICLGHNSMLTDALISQSDEYVITADRDEKIRVSCFPNVYNIKSFCLGHEMFVSSIALVPTDHRLLLSSSGDRTIRIWDYVNGTELAKFEIVPNNSDTEGAIIKLICRLVEGEVQVAVQRYRTSDIVLLRLSGNLQNGLELMMKEKIPTSGNVLDITFCNSVLVYLTDDQNNMLQAWPEDEIANIMKISKDIGKEISLKHSNTYDVLFKRNFDDVQEYRERKMARLMQKCSE